MCLDARVKCECGKKTVQFHLKDNIMVPGVINRLFCPSCSGDRAYNDDTMLHDNGWTIEYDIDLAQNLAEKKLNLEAEAVQPDYIFDNGYACWLELYPGEKEDIQEDLEEIKKILALDQKRYLETIHSWNVERVNGLKAKGWRKVQDQ